MKNSRRPQQEQIDRELLCSTICWDNSGVEKRLNAGAAVKLRVRRSPDVRARRFTVPSYFCYERYSRLHFSLASSCTLYGLSEKAVYAVHTGEIVVAVPNGGVRGTRLSYKGGSCWLRAQCTRVSRVALAHSRVCIETHFSEDTIR